MDDADCLLDYADRDPAASQGAAGAIGYCMSGQYAINAAGQFPETFKAAASIYGVRLITDAPDSPHRIAHNAKGEIYFGCAEVDHWMPLESIAPLREGLKRLNAEVELYPRVEHGFAFPQRPAYNKDAAERHWERLFALWKRNL
jgi:carboxymethylenebutenolidase